MAEIDAHSPVMIIAIRNGQSVSRQKFRRLRRVSFDMQKSMNAPQAPAPTVCPYMESSRLDETCVAIVEYLLSLKRDSMVKKSETPR